MAKKGREANGRAQGAFITLSPSLGTSVSYTFLFFLRLFTMAEPAPMT